MITVVHARAGRLLRHQLPVDPRRARVEQQDHRRLAEQLRPQVARQQQPAEEPTALPSPGGVTLTGDVVVGLRDDARIDRDLPLGDRRGGGDRAEPILPAPLPDGDAGRRILARAPPGSLPCRLEFDEHVIAGGLISLLE